MKNTLKYILLIIGFGFLTYSLYGLYFLQAESPEAQRQLFGMMGVGVLFLVGGAAMGKR